MTLIHNYELNKKLLKILTEKKSMYLAVRIFSISLSEAEPISKFAEKNNLGDK